MSDNTFSQFMSTVCEVCQRRKRSQQSFCSRCYFALPEPARSDLYKRFGNGYEEAYSAAKAWLILHRGEECPK